MKKLLKKTAVSMTALALSLTMSVGVLAQSFKDMPKEDHWSYKAVSSALDKGYIQGTDEGRLDLKSSLTRAQMVTIMNRFKKTQAKADISKFEDVKEGDWFYDEIAKGVEAGFIKGRSETQMAPDQPISRQETFTVMARALGLKGSDESKLETFKDRSDLADWAKMETLALVEAGIVEGDDQGLRPQDKISREEFAQILFKTQGLAPEEGKALYGDANVDGQNYPLVAPFIHPPFYNIHLEVKVDEDGKILSVQDNDTLKKGLAPGATEDFFNKKNGTYFKLAMQPEVLNRFVGLDRAGVEALKMDSGQADAVTGATESGRALRQAILNAFDNKEGKKFLVNTQDKQETLKTVKVEETSQGYRVVFSNTLPEDFKVKLHSVSYGIYNGEDILSGDKYDWKEEDGTFVLELKDPQARPGKYFVNIIDESETYRSPNFESGHGTPRGYPYFVIEGKEKIDFVDGVLKVPGGDWELFNKNIEEIEVAEVDKEGNVIKDDDGKDLIKDVEPVGHHGTKSSYADQPLIKNDGTIDPTVKFGRKNEPVFEEGKTYKITIHTYGLGRASASFTAVGVPNPEPQNEEILATAPVGSLGYDLRVKITMDKDKIKDLDASTSKVSTTSELYHDMFLRDGGLSHYIGKTKADIEKEDLHVVTGATASSKAAREAILKGLK